jgi:hypothetical protein
MGGGVSSKKCGKTPIETLADRLEIQRLAKFKNLMNDAARIYTPRKDLKPLQRVMQTGFIANKHTPIAPDGKVRSLHMALHDVHPVEYQRPRP